MRRSHTPSLRLLGALLFGAVLAAPAAVAAPAPPLCVHVDTAAQRLVPAAALREALANELHVPAVEPSADTRFLCGMLVIEALPDRRLLVTYRDTTGGVLQRTLTAPRDPIATVEILALIAGNLVRNEAEDLLGQLAPQPQTLPPPPPAPEEETPPPPPPTIPPPPPVFVAPPPSLARPATPVVAVGARAPNRARAHPFTLALEGFVAGAPSVGVISSGGLTLGYTPARMLTLGVRAGGGALRTDSGWRPAVSGGPYVELFHFVLSWLQLYGDGGVAVQGRFGGGLSPNAGAAAYAGAGARFWLGRRFTVAAGGRVHFILGDGFAFGDVLVPRNAIVLGGNVELGLHF